MKLKRKIRLFNILYKNNYASKYKEKVFSGIQFKGDFNYIKQLNLVYDGNIQDDLYRNGKPCIYTDKYFPEESSYYKECLIRHSRSNRKYSIFSIMRFLSKVKGIPKNTLIVLSSDHYINDNGKNYSLSFKYNIQNVTKFPKFKYQVNYESYKRNMDIQCKESELVDLLRKNKFLVAVHNENPDRLYGEHTGCIAIASGYGLRIGFSSGNETFMGYSDGRNDVLFDIDEDFDKWSRCMLISKETPNEEIVKQLIEYNKE